jgi:7-cyano-7-deazaguanine synthase
MGRECYALSFDYGQRHARELDSARQIALHYGVAHHLIHVDPLVFSKATDSALTNPAVNVHSQRSRGGPTTYVPCRNLLFLSHAAAMAEAQGAREIFFGAHANDGPTYPDCTQAFLNAFSHAVEEGSYITSLSILCPLLTLDKAAVVALGRRLQAPLDLTWSCYNPQGNTPCLSCSACAARMRAMA